MLQNKVPYVTNENQNILYCKSTDVKPLPVNAAEDWIVHEIDTGKIYAWNGSAYVVTNAPSASVVIPIP